MKTTLFFTKQLLLVLLIWQTQIVCSEPKTKMTSYNPIGADWKPFSINWTSKQTPVWDFSSYYETPAGKDGFLRVKGPHFELGNSGKRIRLWGTNLCSTSCFPSHEYAPKVTAFLKRWGFNAVRLAHMDSHWAKGLINYRNKHKLVFDNDKFDRMFFFMAELKKNGIYYVIDGRHGFHFHTKEFNFLSYSQRGKSGSIFLYFSSLMQGHHEKYLRKLFTTPNKYTGLTLADDPALAGVQMLNETFMPRNSRKLKTLKNIPAPIRPEFLQKWKEWNKIAGQKIEYNVADNVTRNQFFSWLERSYFKRMKKFYREELGIKCPIATTSCYVSPSGFLSAGDGDFTEGHSYYNLSYTNALVIRDSVTLKEKKVKLAKVERTPAYINRQFRKWLPFTVRQRISYQPYILGEWNSSHPFPERFDSALWMTTLGNIQNFDGMFMFTLAQYDWEKIHKRNIDYVISFEDPSIMINMIPAALAWYGKMIPPAKELAVTIPEKVLYGKIDKRYYHHFYANSLNFSLYNCPVGPGFKMPPPEVQRIKYNQKASEIIPELYKKAKDNSPVSIYKQHVIVKTPKWISIWGRLGKEKYNISPLELIVDSKQDFSVTAVALDNKPLTTSAKILFAIGPISLAKGTMFINKTDVKTGKVLGLWSLNRKMQDPMVKPINASLGFLKGKNWRCFKVSNAGIKGTLVKTSNVNGIRWKLKNDKPSYFYLLER